MVFIVEGFVGVMYLLLCVLDVYVFLLGGVGMVGIVGDVLMVLDMLCVGGGVILFVELVDEMGCV